MSSTLNRRKFIKLTSIAATSLSLMSMKNFRSFTAENNKQVIIDADSANEIDDLLALFRLITAPRVNVTGLCASHWSAGSSIEPSSMQQSYEMNKQVVKNRVKNDIPLLKGAEKPLTSTATPIKSEASDFIIQQAKSLTGQQVLRIISLGIPTNLASALILYPEIAPKIECYIMALDYYKYQSHWDTSDLPSPGQYAYDTLLKTPGLSLKVMTASASQDMTFSLSSKIGRASCRERV
jgi:purine nucleosidase